MEIQATTATVGNYEIPNEITKKEQPQVDQNF